MFTSNVEIINFVLMKNQKIRKNIVKIRKKKLEKFKDFLKTLRVPLYFTYITL